MANMDEVDWRGHRPNNAKRAFESHPNVPTERFVEKDLPMLVKAFSGVCEKWIQIGSLVNGSSSSEALKKKHGSNSVRGLIDVIVSWINSEMRFDPCWWSVVYIIADSLGGNDSSAAMTIAKGWKEFEEKGLSDIALKGDETPLCDISDIGKRRGIIDDLLLFLIDVQDKWFEIGVLLGVPVSKLEVIDKGQFSSEDKLRKLIEIWLLLAFESNLNLPTPTVQVLIDAVAHQMGGDNEKLAQKIAQCRCSTGQISQGPTCTEGDSDTPSSQDEMKPDPVPTIGENMPETKAESKVTSPVARIIDYISDDKLQEVAFRVHLKRVSLLLSAGPLVYEQVEYAVQVLWELLNKSSHPLRRSFAKYTANEPHLTALTLRSCLESYGDLSGKSQLPVYIRLLHLICLSISHQPTKCLDYDQQLVKDVLKVLKDTANSPPHDVMHEEGIVTLVLFLYLCANNPPVYQLLKQNSCIQSIGQLTELSSIEIKVLSRALIARLIPNDAVSDDMAVLILIGEDEVEYLISLMIPTQSYKKIPVISIMVDLSRSPHNLFAFASKDVVLKLSDSMESLSEDDQAKSALLIWRIMELDYDGSEEMSVISNSGTLQDVQSKDWQVEVSGCRDEIDAHKEVDNGFISYIVDSFETGMMDTNMVSNLSAAMVLQFLLMMISEAEFRKESAASLKSTESCCAIPKLTANLCIVHFEEANKKIDIHLVVLKCLVWWTGLSETASAGLSRSSIITNICNLLPIFINSNMKEKIDLCLKILINCSSDLSNLPGFNCSFSHSDVVISLLPLTHGEILDLALHSKMLLALLNPLLDCEQLLALKLTRDEANTCVSLLRKAIEDPQQMAEDFSLLTILRAIIWFIHEYHRQDKSLKKNACSEYESKLVSVSQELRCNIELLVREDVLPCVKVLLNLSGKEELQATAARLLWCLAHDADVKKKTLADNEILGALKDAENHSSPKLKMASHCVLSLLGLQADGPQSLMKYAQGCLEFRNFFECIDMCDSILKDKKDKTDIEIQAKIIKGKASFYSYKRKLQYITINPNIRAIKEGRIILEECFSCMKESITLLGIALDHNALDEEGSKLLDWAMIDCISKVNQLNKCNRCFLCRQEKKLMRSHVIPEFIAKNYQDNASDRIFVFGLDKHLLKSAGECHYYMLCGRCEELLCQNGESDFKAKFPTSGEIKYSSWLFSFCVGLIFRNLSITIQFPWHFNDEDVFKIILQCRKYLLQLPVMIGGKLSPLSDQEKKQLEKFTQKLEEDLDIYLFMSPLHFQLNFGVFQIPYPSIASVISRNKQLDNKNLNFNGRIRFYCLFCGPITLVIQFDQSLYSLKNKGFHLKSKPADSDLNYSISSEENRVKLLPPGFWPLIEQLTEGTMEDSNKVSRFISERAKLPAVQPVQSTPPVIIPTKDVKAMFPVSYLPREFEISKPHVRLPHNQCVTLPADNHVIIHSSRHVPMQSVVITTLLCVNECKLKSDSDQFYLLFMLQNNSNHTFYVDGARAEVKENKLVLTEFLLHNKLVDANRFDLSQLQNMLSILLPNKYFDNINFLMHLVKSRSCIKGPLGRIMPSLDQKCCPEGCWYCSDLCHHCMQPSSTLYSGVLKEKLLKFCSEECKALWFPSDKKSLHVASYLDGTCPSDDKVGPLMTIISRGKNEEKENEEKENEEKSVEQIFLFIGVPESLQNVERPYVIWHIREVEHQRFAHFYISDDSLPLNSVWVRQICTSESEIVSNLITTKRKKLQGHLLEYFSEAAKEYGFENFKAFLEQIKTSSGVSIQYELMTRVSEDMERPAIQSNLPPGFTFCDPRIDFAHCSFKYPINFTNLLHCVDEEKHIHTVYLLTVANLFDSSLPLELYIISMKHHLKEGWYFADGAVLSSDGAYATRFLVEEPVHERGPEAMEEMNKTVQRIVPKMLGKSGISSIQPLLWLTKYTWLNPIAVKADLRCLSSSNCWFCQRFCHCCSEFLFDPKRGEEFCSEKCHAMFKKDSSAIPADIFSQAELVEIFKSNMMYSKVKCLPLLAFVKKVLSTDIDKNTLLRIYLGRADDSFDVLPPGTLFAICQIRTVSTQAVIDCVLSRDYIPLKPVWYSDYCEQMIEKHRALLHPEIVQLITQTHL